MSWLGRFSRRMCSEREIETAGLFSGESYPVLSIVTDCCFIYRAKELDQLLQDPSISDNRKREKRNNMRRAEAQYLRFLRTKERPQNFSTVKIIGKGAFGEVKLVRRNTDRKIYALKSLVKSEMVRNDSLRITG